MALFGSFVQQRGQPVVGTLPPHSPLSTLNFLFCKIKIVNVKLYENSTVFFIKKKYMMKHHILMLSYFQNAISKKSNRKKVVIMFEKRIIN